MWARVGARPDAGGDDTAASEDKLAIQWAIKAPAFEAKGCVSGCHARGGKEFGSMSRPAGEATDLWYWRSVRTGPVGQADDQYMDDTPFDPAESPHAGRRPDPKTGGGYADNATAEGKGPMFARKGNAPAPPYWIREGESEAFAPSKYRPGDEVPGILVAPFTGDRGDIAAAGAWQDGVWTVELARQLVTGSPFDVQFTDLRKRYAFAIAVFDNTPVRHAIHLGALSLTFGQ
jgi:hypothetical protein